MLKNWFDVVDRTLGEEGGYSNDPKDPGGETNWGISKRQFPDEDIKNLTRAEAVRLYYNYYWQAPGIAALPLELAFQVFDCGVNIGAVSAVRMLQNVIGVPADGQVGPQTRAAVSALPLAVVILGFLAARERGYLNSHNWDSFGKGWISRHAQCVQWASEDLKVGPVLPSPSRP
jgi:lysozyme family protein